MLDIKLLREEPEKVKKGIAAKQADPKLVDEFLRLDNEWRKLTQYLDEKRAEQKKLGANREIEAAKSSKEEIKIAEEKISKIEKDREAIWLTIPNLPSEDTPVGKSEADNKVLRTNGELPKFDFKPKGHLEIGEASGFIDVASAAEVSGSRFAYLKGDVAMLEFALIHYAFEFLTNSKLLESITGGLKPNYSSKAFIPIVPPVLIRGDVFQKMARLEPKEERYRLEQDDLYLVGSAEHTLGPLHMNEVIPEEKLPIRYVGFSTCFRREAGSYGKDTRGILRVHQFDKVEMESFTTSEDSRTEQDFFVAIQENLMWALELPYRVVNICTADMGGPDYRQIDIETWLPSEGKYRETHSADLNTDYQSRRLGTRVKRKDGKIEFAHMNDATVFAIGRMIIAILENYQMKDGRVAVPKVLQKYVNKKIIG
ncbi:MAG: serine--tRNA ligase [bacterium]|nr:serine--tRNA ligase [bacterium]